MNKGFTLIELLIVVAIIGILAAIGTAVIPNILKKTKITAINEQHSNIVNFIQLEKAQCDLGNPVQFLITAASRNGTEHKYEPPCGDFLNPSQILTSATKMSAHLLGKGYKNILEPSKPFHEYSGGYCSSNGGFSPGCSEITGSKGIMNIRTCLEGSCTNDEVITKMIDFN